MFAWDEIAFREIISQLRKKKVISDTFEQSFT